MSGIAGIIRLDGANVQTSSIAAMTTAMNYRGPDGINHWVKGSVGLGQCMMRTTPEAIEETQPLTNESESIVLVMDGWLSNWEELRARLATKGARLRTRADTELVLRAYEFWGNRCLEYIEGDFALAIWNSVKRELFIGRDRFGIKQLHYYFDGACFIFSTDLHPIFAGHNIPQLPNEDFLSCLFSDEWHSRTQTIWKSVLRLDSAQFATVSADGFRATRYWSPNYDTFIRYRTDQEYFDHYRELFFDVVRRYSRSAQDTAYEVSGGLDSSAIFCAAHRLHATGRLPSSDIRGYTVDFSRNSQASEIEYARAIGTHLGRIVEEVAPKTFDIDWYRNAARLYRNFPAYPNGSMLEGLHREAARRGSNVIVGGAFGDHVLSGSNAYFADELRQMNWQKLADCLFLDATAHGLKPTTRAFIRDGLIAVVPRSVKDVLWPIFRAASSPNEKKQHLWLSERLRRTLRDVREHTSAREIPPLRTRGQLHLDQLLNYPFDAFGVCIGDRQLAALGLEPRYPFAAKTMIDFAFAIPARLRMRGGIDKFTHVGAMREVVPRMVIERRSKADFAVTATDVLLPHQDEIMELGGRYPQWLDANGLSELWLSYVDRPEEGWQNWVLLNIMGGLLAISEASVDIDCRREV